MQGPPRINTQIRDFFNGFLFAEVCRVSRRQGWSDKSWLERRCFEEDKMTVHCIASIPRLHPKYTSLIALHRHWQTPESIGRYCYLPPLVMATPCCPPRIPSSHFYCLQIPRVLLLEFFSLKTQYWGLLFQGQLFSWFWTLKLNYQFFVLYEVLFKSSTKTQKLCSHFFGTYLQSTPN